MTISRRRAARDLLATLALAAACGRGPAPPPGPPPVTAPPAVEALAEARTEWPQLTIQVVDATRAGAILVVRLRFGNGGTQPFPFGDRFAADPADRDTVADVAVMEPSGLRKYFVLRDRENRPDCGTSLAPLEPGEKRLIVARFPAPPPGTSRITIQVPHVPDFREVPVGGTAEPGSR